MLPVMVPFLARIVVRGVSWAIFSTSRSSIRDFRHFVPPRGDSTYLPSHWRWRTKELAVTNG